MQEIRLTSLQESHWTETKARFLFKTPAFAHVFFTLMRPVFTEAVPTAAVDGKRMYANPGWFFGLPIAQRVFVLAHETCHNIFNHIETGAAMRRRGKVLFPNGDALPYDHGLMNRAMDYVINDLLIEARIGEFPPQGMHDRRIATSRDSIVDAYRKIWQDQQDNPRPRPGPGEPGGGFDEHLEPGPGDAPRDADEWRAAVVAGLAQERAQGRDAGVLARALGEAVNPGVPWQEHIKTLLARRIGNDRSDWRRPDRRLMERELYGPSRRGSSCGTVAVVCDTSGSISDKEVAMFFGEISGMIEELSPERLVVMWADDRVHRVDELEDAGDLAAIKGKPVPGGGGTSFVPAFARVRELGLAPDAVIYLTDGYGSFPPPQPYPVIWGTIAAGPEHYPFGDVVTVPRKQ